MTTTTNTIQMYTLRLIGLTGTLFFIFCFSLTFYRPAFIEEIGKDFIKQKIAEKTRTKIDEIKLGTKDSKLLKMAEKLYKNNEEKAQALKTKLNEFAESKIASVIDKMRDLSCECRAKYKERIKESINQQITSLNNINEKLLSFMKSKYMEVAIKLQQEFRIFTGINTFAFLLILIASFVKPKAVAHLFVPCLLIMLSVSICSYFYLFNQNWFFTIIYNDYLGWGYLMYLIAVLLFLFDIIWNRGRVTTQIINAICEAVGSAFTVVPC